MYAAACALATCAESEAFGEMNATSTSRLFLMGVTCSRSRYSSITRDCASVSSAAGASPWSAEAEGHKSRNQFIVPARSPTSCFEGSSSSCSHNPAAVSVRRASARLCRMRYCVW